MNPGTEQITEKPYPRLPEQVKVPVLKTGKIIGIGMENKVRPSVEQVINNDGTVTEGEPSVVKIPLLSVLWRYRKDIAQRCRDAMDNEKIPHLPVELHEKAVLIDGKSGRTRVRKNVQVSSFIENIADCTVDYSMLTDEETGQDTINQVVNIILQSNEMAKKRDLGLDPFGMEAMINIVNSIPPAILLHIIEFLPDPIRNRIRPLIRADLIKVNNLVRHQGEEEDRPIVKLIDIGALELDDPVAGALWVFLYELTMAGLTEMTLCANRDLAKKLGREPDQNAIRKLGKLKEEKYDSRLYQVFAEIMMKILQPYMDKSVEEKRYNKEFDKLPVEEKVLAKLLSVLLGY
ncbi:MAG TPA: hypothetical protein PK398_00140 [Candidatus Gracilibacteria bacterium]|nr:hypothetical protein [Candidatus Gracilibacteria bacterium]